MNDDGSVKDMPATESEKLGYHMQPILSLEELGIEVGQDWARRCEQWNRLEVDDAIIDLGNARTDLARLPHSKDISLLVVFIENVVGKFDGWFSDHGFEKPSLEGLPFAAAALVPKGLRGPKDLGKLYVEAVEHFQNQRPTLNQLSQVSQTSVTTWHNHLGKPQNLLAIDAAVEKKIHMAKTPDKEEWWELVHADMSDRIVKLSDRIRKGREKSVGGDIERYGADDEQFERID